jgi:hypothetical protein
MNDNRIDAELAQNQFATAVRNFTPKPSAKFQELLPLKDGIAELGARGRFTQSSPTSCAALT